MFPDHLSGGGAEGADGSVFLFAWNVAEAAAVELFAFLVLGFAGEVNGAGFAGSDIHQVGSRAVAGAVPVIRARDTGPDFGSVERRRSTGDGNGPAAIVQALGPGLLRVRLAVEKFTRHPV